MPHVSSPWTSSDFHLCLFLLALLVRPSALKEHHLFKQSSFAGVW